MRSGSLRYVPALDGLRGVAVALVICAHTLRHFVAGRVGVDVFFVLSGYLITTILLNEARLRGVLDLRAFYIRRMLRLAPPLLVVLLAYIAGTPLWLSKGVSLASLAVTWIASVTYTWNLLIVWQVLPAGIEGALSHLWSLAQEEQFYLIFPLALLAAAKRGWDSLTLRRWLVGAGAAMLALYALSAGSGFSEFSPVTRGFGLVAGCLLALQLRDGHGYRPGSRLAWCAALGLGMAIAGTTVGWLPSASDIPAAVPATFIIIWHVTSRPLSSMSRLLRTRVLIWLGLTSYSLYLWHLPLLVLAREVMGLNRAASAAFAIPVALLLAELTRRWVEVPMAKAKERWVRGRPKAADSIADSVDSRRRGA